MPQASAQGRPIYARLGFEPVGQYTEYQPRHPERGQADGSTDEGVPAGPPLARLGAG